MPYSYHLTRKDFTPIPLDKPAQDVVGTLLPICQNGFVSYLHDFKRIYRIDSRKNRLETLYSCKGDTIFNSVSADENGIFWIGSNYGLSYYSMEKKQCINIPNSLINEINSLICDQRGRVWIGADSKLFAHVMCRGIRLCATTSAFGGKKASPFCFMPADMRNGCMIFFPIWE